MTEFDKLLGDVETLAKAMKGDEAADAKIEAAAGDVTVEGDESDEDKKKAAGDKGKKMCKALTVTLEDGTQVEAEDGTELVKSLTETMGALTLRVESSESTIAKALTGAVDLLKAQGEQIKTLTASVKALSSEGRGRKAVVSIVDKGAEAALAKAEGANTFNPDAFMAKAEAHFNAGRLTGHELSYIESSFNKGVFQLPQALVTKVSA